MFEVTKELPPNKLYDFAKSVDEEYKQKFLEK